MKYLLPLILFLSLALNADAKIIYVRPLGGTGSKCDGTHDADQAGAVDGDDVGTIPDCAFNHIQWPLPLYGQTQTWKATGGDTVVIKNNADGSKAEYRMGCQGTGNCRDSAGALVNITQGVCDSSWPYDCDRIVPPSGTLANPTIIIGCSIDGCGSGVKPQLWMSGRQNQLFKFTNTHDVILSDLEITDHSTLAISACPNSKTALCGRVAIYGSGGWYNLTFRNLWIHGLAYDGFQIGGQVGGTDHNMVMENVIVDKNSFAGIDMDPCYGHTCGVHGPMTFTNVDVTYNGCTEAYPLTGSTTSTEGDLVASGCQDQNNGGYGDGFGSNSTGGDWVFTGCNFSHNTSDGLDLLYHNRRTDLYPVGTVIFKKGMAEGNTGNEIKSSNSTTIEDSILLANCGYWYGKSFKHSTMECCRQSGGAASPIAFEYKSGSSISPKIYNSTLFSNADVMLAYSGSCPVGSQFIVKNNILRGGTDWASEPQDTHNTAFYYGETCYPTLVETNNVVYGAFKNLPTLDASDVTGDPKFTGTILQGPGKTTSGYYSGDDYAEQVYIASDSSAVDLADETISGLDAADYNNFARGASWDSGALEYGSTPAAPSCQTDCSLCTSQVNCEGSTTTCYWAASGVCLTGADPCQTDCQECVGQTACEASDATCFWWSTTGTCETTEYVPPANCDTDCTECANPTACLASAFPCFVQLDNSCASTIDPCNAYCNDCLTEANCLASTYAGGCHWWTTGQCRTTAESCSQYNQDASICENTIGCYWHYNESTPTCQNTMEGKFLIKGATIYGLN